MEFLSGQLLALLWALPVHPNGAVLAPWRQENIRDFYLVFIMLKWWRPHQRGSCLRRRPFVPGTELCYLCFPAALQSTAKHPRNIWRIKENQVFCSTAETCESCLYVGLLLLLKALVAHLYLTLRSHGSYPARILCLWDFSGKNTGVGCHFLLQGIFPTQGWKPCLLYCQAGSLPLNHQGSPNKIYKGLEEGSVSYKGRSL